MRALKKPPRSLGLSQGEELEPNGSIRDWASNAATKEFRRRLSLWTIKRQKSRCAYCQVRIGVLGRRGPELDHFVPKSRNNGVPEWTFEVYNLLLVCEWCNKKLKKQFNPLLAANPRPPYRNATFSICHPYLDRVRDHIDGGPYAVNSSTVTPTALTEKGRKTIKLFELDSVPQRSIWCQELLDRSVARGAGGLSSFLQERRSRILEELGFI